VELMAFPMMITSCSRESRWLKALPKKEIRALLNGSIRVRKTAACFWKNSAQAGSVAAEILLESVGQKTTPKFYKFLLP